jgi:hypothetical protein
MDYELALTGGSGLVRIATLALHQRTEDVSNATSRLGKAVPAKEPAISLGPQLLEGAPLAAHPGLHCHRSPVGIGAWYAPPEARRIAVREALPRNLESGDDPRVEFHLPVEDPVVVSVHEVELA